MIRANPRLQLRGEPERIRDPAARAINQGMVRFADMPPAGSISRGLIGVAAALALLYVLRSVVVPLSVALLLMMLIDGQARWLKRFCGGAPDWAPRAVAVALVIASLGVCVILLTLGASGIAADTPALTSRLQEMLADFGRVFGAVPVRLNDFVDQESLMQFVTPAVSSIGNLLSGAALAVLFLGFMIASRHVPATKVASLARTPEGAERLRSVIDRIGRGAGTYIWVQTVTGALYAAASGALLYLVGLDNVPFWTILIFLLSYIPVVGVGIASALPALFALIQFPTYWQAFAALLAVQVPAFVVGNIVLPKMQADSQNIDPTVGIFSVALWTLLWGIPGAFLAIPLTVMAMIVFAQFERTRWVAVLISENGVPERGGALGGDPLRNGAAARLPGSALTAPNCGMAPKMEVYNAC